MRNRHSAKRILESSQSRVFFDLGMISVFLVDGDIGVSISRSPSLLHSNNRGNFAEIRDGDRGMYAPEKHMCDIDASECRASTFEMHWLCVLSIYACLYFV